MAVNASAARHAPHVPNPIAPTDENLMAGMKLFNDDCAGCHCTPDTAGKNEANVTFYPNAPRFALHPPQAGLSTFLDREERCLLYRHVCMGRQFALDASGKDVSDEKIWTAVTFLAHLDSLPRSVNAEWHKTSAN